MSIPSLFLEGKTAIVTGARRGNGEAIALTLAEAGADVAVCDLVVEDGLLEAVAKKIRGFGRRSLTVQANVSQKTDVDKMVQKVIDEFGAIDILVNNAGIAHFDPVVDYSEEEWDRMIDINLKGCYLCSQAVGKRMVKQKRGNIVNIASTDAILFDANNTPYSAAKAGVVMLTRGMAKELASYNMRINAIAPGWVKTEMSKAMRSDPEAYKEALAAIPMGRLAEPTDIANAALFLVSDLASYITGITIIVDGGCMA